MGYTHYWYQKRDFTIAEWAKITNLFENEIKPANENVLANWEGQGDPQSDESTISFNGKGDYSHETFSLNRTKREIYAYENVESFEREGAFNCCKTASKPYDEAVVDLLIGVREIAVDAILLSSDGDVFDD